MVDGHIYVVARRLGETDDVLKTYARRFSYIPNGTVIVDGSVAELFGKLGSIYLGRGVARVAAGRYDVLLWDTCGFVRLTVEVPDGGTALLKPVYPVRVVSITVLDFWRRPVAYTYRLHSHCIQARPNGVAVPLAEEMLDVREVQVYFPASNDAKWRSVLIKLEVLQARDLGVSTFEACAVGSPCVAGLEIRGETATLVIYRDGITYVEVLQAAAIVGASLTALHYLEKILRQRRSTARLSALSKA